MTVKIITLKFFNKLLHSMGKLLLGTALFFGLTMTAMAEDKVVNVYNWSDYIDDSLLADFEKQTGIKVVYDVFDSNDILETKLLAGNSGYDVVVPSASFLQRQIKAGVFQPLDRKALTNSNNLWQLILDRTNRFDPGNKYSVNYMWGTTGIGFNEAKIKERIKNPPLDSWALVFDEKHLAKLKDCGVYVLDAPDEIIPATLNYIGENPSSHDPEVIKKAEAVLKKIRPYITKFHSSEYINALANGDICLAVGWSGDILQARDRAAEAENGVEVAYVIPKEGALMWFDQMAVPKDAKHPNNAMKFINFMMDAENMAKASNYVYYANGNEASQKHLVEDVIDDPAIYPSEEALKNLYVVEAYPPKSQRVLNRIWTKVKSNL